MLAVIDVIRHAQPRQWAEDIVTLHALIQEIFPPHATKPSINAPGNAWCAGGNAWDTAWQPMLEWSTYFLGNITSKAAAGTHPLAAFTFHGYQHYGRPTVDAIAAMNETHIDASKAFFEAMALMHNTSTERAGGLWITETAWTAGSPVGASGGGARAAIDGMCRAADIAWNLDALGAAAEAGIDVFCRETLAGDYLETLGLWQPAAIHATP